ncbi:MAG TPA: hypothetical protein VHC91_18750 [Trinickia sp.]|uniref:hypothetical protein n=1 Tax=Trinickia sp. TaxID=2571163 RepID=UPI002CA05C24|nr:hypothetical protein [Trinickia sp.]HVW52398.1 hypothetical protein [Trinickia sp.]
MTRARSLSDSARFDSPLRAPDGGGLLPDGREILGEKLIRSLLFSKQSPAQIKEQKGDLLRAHNRLLAHGFEFVGYHGTESKYAKDLLERGVLPTGKGPEFLTSTEPLNKPYVKPYITGASRFGLSRGEGFYVAYQRVLAESYAQRATYLPKLQKVLRVYARGLSAMKPTPLHWHGGLNWGLQDNQAFQQGSSLSKEAGVDVGKALAKHYRGYLEMRFERQYFKDLAVIPSYYPEWERQEMDGGKDPRWPAHEAPLYRWLTYQPEGAVSTLACPPEDAAHIRSSPYNVWAPQGLKDFLLARRAPQPQSGRKRAASSESSSASSESSSASSGSGSASSRNSRTSSGESSSSGGAKRRSVSQRPARKRLMLPL